jgi:hypothetical protein
MAVTSGNSDHRSASDASPAPATREINALLDEACAVLDKHSNEQNAFERHNIQEAAIGGHGSPRHALRNLIAHLPNHRAATILQSYKTATSAGLPEDVLLTNDHIATNSALYSCARLSQDEETKSKAAYAEYKKIVAYAMNNIEDGELIVNMYVDRGMRTLQGILDLLPALKDGHQTLTEGVL